MFKAKDNPFTVGRVEKIRYHFTVGGLDELVVKIIRADYRGAIVGPEGSGKTTLLEDLFFRFRELGFDPCLITFNRSSNRLKRSQDYGLLCNKSWSDIILVDGAEQLGAWDWWRLKRLAHNHRGFIITAHEEGLLPTLYQTAPDVTLLAHLVNKIMGMECAATMLDLDELYLKHSGNIRLILRELYDHYATDGRQVVNT